jgi:tRNA threonylcarbamoyladenosine biosynthesis protein TsaB
MPDWVCRLFRNQRGLLRGPAQAAFFVMPSLAQLLANHGRLLLLDAASSRVQVGLMEPGRPAVWQSSTQEAGVAVFANAEVVLKQTGVGIGDIGAFVFCEGPGSTLGTRTVAMTIRTWLTLKPRPVYRYQSLALLAHGLRHSHPSMPFSVITDARRDTWHCQTSNAAGLQTLRRATAAEIAAASDTLYQPAAFRAWSPTPRPAKDCAYDVAELLAAQGEADLFTVTDSPDAFQHEAPVYKKWSAVGHSAATAGTR